MERRSATGYTSATGISGLVANAAARLAEANPRVMEDEIGMTQKSLRTTPRVVTFVDLFSGAGGFTEGFLLAGDATSRFKLVAASDIHANACLTHTRRFQQQLGLDYEFLTEDIRSGSFIKNLLKAVSRHTDGTEVDVVVGGPPCQGFSVFGKREENDPRNDLFRSYLKVIQVLKPKFFVMENVPGLATMYEGKTVDRIFSEVAAMSPTRYSIAGPIKVNAMRFGVPQNRERILFVGSREDVPAIDEVRVPRPSRVVTVSEALGDLSFLRSWESNGHYHHDFPATSSYQRDCRRGRLFAKLGIRSDQSILSNHEAPRHTPDVIARFAMIEPGEGLGSIPAALWDSHLQTAKKWCVKLDPNKPSFTVVTLPDDFVHYSRPRTLTVREMARLQSFDDTFVFYGPRASGGGGKGNKKRNVELPQYSQVGNAVPPLMAKGIADTVLSHLSQHGRKEATNEISRPLHHRVSGKKGIA